MISLIFLSLRTEILFDLKILFLHFKLNLLLIEYSQWIFFFGWNLDLLAEIRQVLLSILSRPLDFLLRYLSFEEQKNIWWIRPCYEIWYFYLFHFKVISNVWRALWSGTLCVNLALKWSLLKLSNLKTYKTIFDFVNCT